MRHAATFMHKAAIAFLTESPADNAGLMPSVSTFQNVLQMTQAGRANSQSIIGGAKKLRTLQWCLAEGKRSMHLEFLLKDAMSISLSCDKRNTRFVLRFRASDRHVNVISGILAISQNISTVQVPGADSYRQALLQGLLHAATPKKPPPDRLQQLVPRVGLRPMRSA